MAQEVTIGGDRLGSGQKQQIELHDYKMNSFNQSQIFRSSIAPGLLYPFLRLVGTNHGTFDIDLSTICRTLPTMGPLFGSFKLQIDLFSVPFRLYQGILHNNPLELGLNMNKVYLPKIRITTIEGSAAPRVIGANDDNRQINDTALMKYLGLSGIGTNPEIEEDVDPENRLGNVTRKIQCVPVLAYYDIFKCYYSNKQEENAYVITPGTVRQNTTHLTSLYLEKNGQTQFYNPYTSQTIEFTKDEVEIPQIKLILYYVVNQKETFELTEAVKQKIKDTQLVTISYSDFAEEEYEVIFDEMTIQDIIDDELWIIQSEEWRLNKLPGDQYPYTIEYTLNITNQHRFPGNIHPHFTNIKEIMLPTININFENYYSDIHLEPFALKNIDIMRQAILNKAELNYEFILGLNGNDDWKPTSGEDNTGLPYSTLFKKTTEGITYNAFALNGLVTKTYQSDMYTSFLKTDFVEQIRNLTTLDATNGITQDDLILNEKIYELLNRILVSGATYQDWQDAVYGEGAVRMCETPMYIGGMSAEVAFDEVVSMSATDINGDASPLGTLAGKGQDTGHKGGKNIHVTMKEPGFVMGIVSLTPRISYSQGNEWDLTELETLDDLHKPELDGIGFQEIPAEQVAWWTTKITDDSSDTPVRQSYGMTTAWMNYQTAVDKCFGDFANGQGYSFMVLNRGYEHDPDNVDGIKDATSYIDPAKFNYAFAVQDLFAQNFWINIKSDVVARRKMGAQQLPNL